MYCGRCAAAKSTAHRSEDERCDQHRTLTYFDNRHSVGDPHSGRDFACPRNSCGGLGEIQGSALPFVRPKNGSQGVLRPDFNFRFEINGVGVDAEIVSDQHVGWGSTSPLPLWSFSHSRSRFLGNADRAYDGVSVDWSERIREQWSRRGCQQFVPTTPQLLPSRTHSDQN